MLYPGQVLSVVYITNCNERSRKYPRRMLYHVLIRGHLPEPVLPFYKHLLRILHYALDIRLEVKATRSQVFIYKQAVILVHDAYLAHELRCEHPLANIVMRNE